MSPKGRYGYVNPPCRFGGRDVRPSKGGLRVYARVRRLLAAFPRLDELENALFDDRDLDSDVLTRPAGFVIHDGDAHELARLGIELHEVPLARL